MIVILDYGMGNVGSLRNMFRHVGSDPLVSADPSAIAEASHLVLPGVGAFDAGMESLRATGMIDLLRQRVLVDRVPLLGVCLGLQLLTRGSDEGSHGGLGWLDAHTRSFAREDGSELRIPHMGWNELETLRPHPLLRDLPPAPRFYFVHSFHLECHDASMVVARTCYGYPFPSVVASGNVMGTQFHPEKSLKWGMALLTNFAGRWSDRQTGPELRETRPAFG